MILRPVLRPVLRSLLMDDDGPPFPRSLFASGEQGIWLDPSDFSTLFQDAAGTTPVTALGQPVGLALDKRLGLALGAELFVEANTIFVGESSRVSPGVYRIYSSAGAYSSVVIVPSGVSAGKVYDITFTVDSIATVGSGIQLDAAYASIITTTGIKRFRFVAATSNISVKRTGSACDFQISNVTVRELPGNHAYQTTSAARQTAQSNYLSLDKTDDHLLVAAGGAGTTGFLLVTGIMVPASGTARTLWSDRGTNTGYKVGIDASNQIFLSAGNGAAFVTATGPALVAGTKYVITAWHDGANLNISVNNGAPTQAAFVTATAGTATFTIGKSNGAAAEYWGDRIYSMVYRKNDTSNAGQRSSLYSYTVGKMGGL